MAKASSANAPVNAMLRQREAEGSTKAGIELDRFKSGCVTNGRSCASGNRKIAGNPISSKQKYPANNAAVTLFGQNGFGQNGIAP
jgi:hypothetical protein